MQTQERQRLRAWLEYVAHTAIDLLDDMDAADADLEDDELGNDDALDGDEEVAA
jgi:hypothetical protein